MPRRIDVELTSAKEDGSFTWRAAGAKQPKGVVPASLLYGGAKVGDVVRAEADFDVEGITIVSVVPPPQAAARTEAARIEIVGTGHEEPGVTSSASAGGRGPRPDDDRRRSRDRDGERRTPRDGERRPGGPSDRGARGPGGPSDRGARGPRPDRGGPRPERAEGAAAPDRPRPSERDRHGPRPDRSERSDRGGRPERGARPERAAQGDRPGRPPREQGPERSRPKRLSPGSTHRDAYLGGLAPEQQVVAELLFRGSIPAVRAAVAQQNQNRAEGAPAIDAEPLVRLAEELLPSVREAEWRDRAEAAKALLDEVGLRDLRAIVTASDASARGDEAKALAAELREGLERRTVAEREEWLAEMASCLANGKVIRALRLSSRPPDPTTKVPPDVLEQLRAKASETLSPDTPQDQWAALLEAVVASPVRRSVQPVGLPEKAGPALQLAARQASGRIPALAAMLGVDLPPPPGPRPGKGPRTTPPPPPPPAPPAPSTSSAAAPPAEPPAAESVDLEPTSPAEGEPVAADPGLGAPDLVSAVVSADVLSDEAPETGADPMATAVEEPAAAEEPAAVEEPAAAEEPAARAHESLVLGDSAVAEEPEVAADGRPERIDEPEEESSPADA